MSTITVASSTVSGPGRGDYMSVGGHGYGLYRVTNATKTTCNVRRAHARRWLESLHRWAENWILWPLADLKARFTVRKR